MSWASDYLEVKDRIADERERNPEGSLQSEITFQTVSGKDWVLAKAWYYRTPDDPRPGIGHSWLQIPGSTNFTRGSEVENAETSAWGRALVAALRADTRKSVASRDEVRNKQDVVDNGDGPTETQDEVGAEPSPPPQTDGTGSKGYLQAKQAEAWPEERLKELAAMCLAYGKGRGKSAPTVLKALTEKYGSAAPRNWDHATRTHLWDTLTKKLEGTADDES